MNTIHLEGQLAAKDARIRELEAELWMRYGMKWGDTFSECQIGDVEVLEDGTARIMVARPGAAARVMGGGAGTVYNFLTRKAEDHRTTRIADLEAKLAELKKERRFGGWGLGADFFSQGYNAALEEAARISEASLYDCAYEYGESKPHRTRCADAIRRLKK